MKRHPFDLTSFLFGLIFGGAATIYLLADPLAWDVDGRWVLPAALIALGVAGVAGALSSLRGSQAAVDQPDGEPSEPERATPASARDTGEL